MTFAEHLTEISNRTDFELFVASHCVAICTAMEEAATSGFRTFQIDITQPIRGQRVESDAIKATAINCYTIVCNTSMTATKVVLVAKRVEDFLHQLGFAKVDYTNISNACWLTRLLKVEW